MKVKSFILFFAFLLNGIAAFAQYTLHVGEVENLYAPPTSDSRKPDLLDVKWTTPDRCVRIQWDSQNPCQVIAESAGTARILCSARYYKRSDLSQYTITVTKTYTITCLSNDPGPGPTPDPDPDPYPDPDDHKYVKSIEGVPIVYDTYYTLKNGIKHWFARTGISDTQAAIPTNTTGTVTIPDRAEGIDMEEIGNGTFYNCRNVKKIVLSNRTKYLCTNSLWKCGVETIEFGNSIEILYENAIRECNNLKSLTFPASLRQFSGAHDCAKLEEVTLPESVEAIVCPAFEGCPSLKKITILSPEPLKVRYYIGDAQVLENAILYVPKGSKAKYQNASYWKNFKTIKEIGESDDVLVSDIKLNETSASLTVGSTKQLTATVSPSNATDKSVTWKSSNTTVATVSTTGFVTAVSEGSATITCTANDGSEVKATCSITVKKKEDQKVLVSKITLTESSASLTVGSTKQLTATISPSNATDKSVTWKSSNTTVAKVSTTGLVTAVSEGSATITCSANDGSGVKATCSVGVAKETPSSTTVTTSSDGYATFYDSKTAYVLPYGLSAQVITGCDSKKLTYKTIATGSASGIIPKGIAVMLVAANKRASTYTLTSTEKSASYSGTNYLHGSDIATTTSATGSNFFYKLTDGPRNDSPFGWWWGAANGAAFRIEGHKAWLALPQTMSRSLSFSAEGEATYIDEWQNTDAPATIYDLQGRRVNEVKGQGLYIQNGKKRIVK